jgi:hypothetical protein
MMMPIVQKESEPFWDGAAKGYKGGMLGDDAEFQSKYGHFG